MEGELQLTLYTCHGSASYNWLCHHLGIDVSFRSDRALFSRMNDCFRKTFHVLRDEQIVFLHVRRVWYPLDQEFREHNNPVERRPLIVGTDGGPGTLLRP